MATRRQFAWAGIAAGVVLAAAGGLYAATGDAMLLVMGAGGAVVVGALAFFLGRAHA